jgi:CRISPR-associated endoribonuclease Cas6
MSDPEYAQFLHEDGYITGSKRFKLFTFSQLMARNRKIVDDSIYFHSRITWYVSSPQETFLGSFALSLMDECKLRVGTQYLRILDVEIPQLPSFHQEMKFRCLSPITISTKREREGKLVMHYCLPHEPEFSELVRQNLIRKHEAIYGHGPRDDSFSMDFDQEYIKRRKGRITRLVRYKNIDIRGVLCPFYARGSPELMFVGYECGFGDKNGAGFGMVEI